MTKKPSIIVMLAALFCSFLAQAEDHAWVPLFDGESLEGWVQKNGYATYRVEDGMIVGKTAKGSPNFFLCSEKSYGAAFDGNFFKKPSGNRYYLVLSWAECG